MNTPLDTSYTDTEKNTSIALANLLVRLIVNVALFLHLVF